MTAAASPARPAAATFLGGAKSRLLPASIPFRFFGAAAIYNVAAWIALFLAAPEVPDFRGGTGPVLAAIHFMTLGVFATTAMGAAVQLLPVATQAPFRALWPARLMSWLIVAGVPLFSLGVFAQDHDLTVSGAILAVAALALFAALLAGNLLHARGMIVVVLHGWGALASLIVLFALGMILVVDQFHGFLANRATLAQIHMIVAAYGFMGFLAMGFSHVLVPMFALSPAPAKGLGILGFCAAGFALSTTTIGIACEQIWVQRGGALLGVGAIALHLWLMREALRTRMRKRLGPAFILLRAAWVLLLASTLLGLLLFFDIGWPRLPALFGAVLLYGWLATFLFGILQRIVPFLASMHGSRPNRSPPLVSSLTPELPLTVHRYSHAAALVLLFGGIAADVSIFVRLAAILGAIGGLAFLVFFAGVLRRTAAGRSIF